MRAALTPKAEATPSILQYARLVAKGASVP